MSCDRWLDSGEQDSWVPFLVTLMMLPSKLDTQLQRDSGLTLYEYVVLSALSHSDPAGVRMSELAAITSGAPSRLSQVIARMEQHDWVERVHDVDDRRVILVRLLEAGRAQLEAAAPGHVDTVRTHVYDHLTPTQVDQLQRIMMKVALSVSDSRLLRARETFLQSE